MKKILIFLFFNFSIIKASDIINFSLINDKIYLNEVIINGERKSGLFLIDTGSDVTLLNIKEIKSPKINKKENINTYYGKITAVVQPSELKIGNKKLGEINIYYTAGYIFSESCFVEEITGIIGRDLLSKANWKFNMQNREIEISDLPFETSSYIPIPIIKKGKFSKIFVQTYIQGVKKNLFLDTGSNLDITLKKKRNDKTEKYSVFGNKMEETLNLSDTIRIGDEDFHTNITFSNCLNPTMGVGFLKRFEWILNKNDDNIYVLKKEEFSPISKDIKYGFSVMIENQKIIISDIYVESIAEKNGLKLFDEIIQINNTSLLNPNCSTLEEIAKEFKKDKMKITLKDNKQIILSL